MKTHQILLFCCLIFSGCHKPPNYGKKTVITGQVTERTSKKPIPNFNVHIIKFFDNGQHQQRDMGSVQTNSVGVYTYNAIENDEFILYYTLTAGDTSKYYSYGVATANLDEINSHSTLERNIIMTEVGNFNLIVKNMKPFDNNDLLVVTLPFKQYIGSEGYGEKELYGMTVNKTYHFKVVGNSYVKIHYTVRKNGVDSLIKDSMYVKNFSTANYSLNY